MARCYKLHGYPPSFKFRDGSSPPSLSSKPVANHTNADEHHLFETLPEPSKNVAATLSNTQCQQIIHLLSTQLQSSNHISEDQPIVSNFTGHFSGTPDWDG
ncbi:uncharacterized protein LOC133784129 [Humulus lupulus]|uniref:uncharacterized protein LOC133784129 n=1 Tax=Humulus lupulus TaxID=3486 RepID=UPI002B40C7ED|nr:uncharacterized protein LOC133784129 [Humulus lupulus]